MKIKKKMGLAFSSASLILLGLLLFFMIRQVKETVYPLNLSISQQLVTERCEQINNWFEKRLIELDDIATFAPKYQLTEEDLFQELEDLRQKRPENYHSFRLINLDGISKGGDGVDFQVDNREYFQELEKNPQQMYSVSNLVESKEDHEAIVILCYRLKETVGTYQYLAAAVSLDKVLSLAQELPIYDGKGQLLDKNKEEKNLEKGQVLLKGAIPLLPNWEMTYQLSQNKLEENATRFNQHLLFFIVVTLILMGLLLSYLLKNFVQPLLQLKKTMLEVKKGNKDIRAKVYRSDEIGEVAHLFNETLEQVYQNEENYRQATVALMQEQIKPHFLYNTLDTIQWLIMESEEEKAIQMVDELTIFLRKGLNQGQETTTLENEITHVLSYWHIQKVRYENLQDLTVEIPEKGLDEPVLHFILQPIVENALYHGIRPSQKENLYLKIQVKLERDELIIIVKNNGLPMSKEKSAQLNQGIFTGYGLKNVASRLENYYHQQASLKFVVENGETQAIFHLPKQERRKI